jgi:hypothetical protein
LDFSVTSFARSQPETLKELGEISPLASTKNFVYMSWRSAVADKAPLEREPPLFARWVKFFVLLFRLLGFVRHPGFPLGWSRSLHPLDWVGNT